MPTNEIMHMEKTKGNHKHSILGIASLVIGILCILLFLFYTYLFTMWLMENHDIAMRPGGLDGMRVPDSTIAMITFIAIMVTIGFFVGIFGLFEKKKRRILPIIGVILNSLLLFMVLIKL